MDLSLLYIIIWKRAYVVCPILGKLISCEMANTTGFSVCHFIFYLDDEQTVKTFSQLLFYNLTLVFISIFDQETLEVNYHNLLTPAIDNLSNPTNPVHFASNCGESLDFGWQHIVLQIVGLTMYSMPLFWTCIVLIINKRKTRL